MAAVKNIKNVAVEVHKMVERRERMLIELQNAKTELSSIKETLAQVGDSL